MGFNDIIPFASPHGGHSVMRAIPIANSTSYSTADTSYQKGEVCQLVSGKIGAANAVFPTTVTTSGDHLAASHFIAASSSGGELTIANIASAAASIAWLGLFYPVLGEQEFITRNVFTGGTDTRQTPSTTGGAGGVGDPCGWHRMSNSTVAPNGTFGIDTSNNGLIVTRILDSSMIDAGLSGQTPFWVVFKGNGE